MIIKNIFRIPAYKKDREFLETLLRLPRLRIERIISFGQRTPPGEWLRDDQGEWVILLSGSAKLNFYKRKAQAMKPGDYIFIPAGLRHRVESTHHNEPSVWLALHFKK
ncbi:MAG: cupin domain-containing protein [Candidatus Omnitrophica bacterium]|nr:cupin domain-containing protein [Candidatus Omnitrophota bacterium]